ncbi:MAG: hypothetical protein KGP28_01485 [Bdellovibrionales bacterium]|nr:hypothetical protein [Bdellovibrionales bacterium]
MNPLSLTLLGILLIPLAPKASFGQTIADLSRVLPPITDRVSPVVAGDQVMRSSPFGDFIITESETTGHILGFSFNNIGPNRIIPVPATEIGSGPDREYQFRFQSRARQDIYFSVTDTPDEFLSNRMESYLYLFPRHNIPAIELIENGAKGEELKVTLQNGEEMAFDAKTKEILRGVFREIAPLDQNPDRFKRKFATLEYTGSGTLIRVNRRGGDPRLGTTAVVTQGKKTCKIPSSLLFDQNPNSDVNFLFPTDEEFNVLLLKKCGFGLK